MKLWNVLKTLGIIGGSAVLYVGVNEFFNNLELKCLEKKYGIIKNDDGSFRMTKRDSLEETLRVIKRHAELTGKAVKEIRPAEF